MKPTTLSLLVIRSGELEKSVVFYRALGLNLVQEQHGTGPVHYSCAWDEFVLELYPRKASVSEDAGDRETMLGFRVECLEKVLESLRVSGFEDLPNPKDTVWGRMVTLDDPGGYRVQIIQSSDSSF